MRTFRSSVVTDYTQIAIRHEAGHATVALHLGFTLDKIDVSNGMFRTLPAQDGPARPKHDWYIFLAGGIACEKHFYPDRDYDRVGCSRDEDMIASMGGGSIETYLPEALDILRSNEPRLRRLVGHLTKTCIEESFAAQPSLDATPVGPSFELLSRQEIECLWDN
jgi:hypothetical protein